MLDKFLNLSQPPFLQGKNNKVFIEWLGRWRRITWWSTQASSTMPAPSSPLPPYHPPLFVSHGILSSLIHYPLQPSQMCPDVIRVGVIVLFFETRVANLLNQLNSMEEKQKMSLFFYTMVFVLINLSSLGLHSPWQNIGRFLNFLDTLFKSV